MRALLTLALLLAPVALAGDHPGGDLQWDNPLGGTVFSHANHATFGLTDCTDCHTHLFGFARSDTLSMEAMNEGRECGACHAEGGRAFSMSACTTCHRPTVVVPDIVYRNEAMGDTTFSHATHTGYALECLLCHEQSFEMPRGKATITMATIQARKHCGICHNDDVAPFPASDCASCHGKPVP